MVIRTSFAQGRALRGNSVPRHISLLEVGYNVEHRVRDCSHNQLVQPTNTTGVFKWQEPLYKVSVDICLALHIETKLKHPSGLLLTATVGGLDAV